MSKITQYRGIIKRAGLALYKIENDCPNKLIVILSCRLEDEYHDGHAVVIKIATGEVVYQCRRTAIC